MRFAGRIWLLVACVLLLAACGTDDSAPDPGADATPPQASPTTVPAPSMTMEQIIWAETVDADSGAPLDIVDAFTTESPAIIAAIEVTNVPAGAIFTATWTINDQPIEGSEMVIEADGDLPHAWVAFTFTRDEDKLYPIGQLGVVITSDSGDLREDSIQIGFP